MIVGDRLVELLIKNGIDRVFGVPGGQTLPVYDGIWKNSDSISHVLMRDERSAGFAADAYARFTRHVGVCDATVGPGATNLVSPLAEAFCSSIPVLAIISDIPRAWEHRRSRGNASQAIHQLDIFRSVSKWQVCLSDPSAIDDIIDSAFRIATTGKPGPVVISIPDDVAPAEHSYPEYRPAAKNSFYPRYRPAPNAEEVKTVCAVIEKSKKPVIVAGGGIRISGAQRALENLVQLTQIPVLTTISGKGLISESHLCSFGVVGTFGNPVANEILKQSDLIIYLGCKIGQLTTLRFNYPEKQTQIVHLDSDPEEIGRNYPNSIPLLSDAELGINQLSTTLSLSRIKWDWNYKRLNKQLDTWYDDEVQHSSSYIDGIMPQFMMEVLNRNLDNSHLIVCDASLASGWASAYLKLHKPGHRFFAPRGLATLGWGAPAAIAIALAAKTDAKVLHLAGDGGFAYSVQELETMARLKLPIVTVIFNNSTLAWIKHIQKERYQERYISTDFNQVDFSAVAKGFGINSNYVENAADFESALKEAMAAKEPFLIDVKTNQWETPVLTY